MAPTGPARGPASRDEAWSRRPSRSSRPTTSAVLTISPIPAVLADRRFLADAASAAGAAAWARAGAGTRNRAKTATDNQRCMGSLQRKVENEHDDRAGKCYHDGFGAGAPEDRSRVPPGPGSRVRSPESGVRSPESGVRSRESVVRSPAYTGKYEDVRYARCHGGPSGHARHRAGSQDPEGLGSNLDPGLLEEPQLRRRAADRAARAGAIGDRAGRRFRLNRKRS